MDEIYLTKSGYEKLCAELEFLKTVRRKELSRAVGTAREHGDLSENAEYDAAKEAQGHNEDKIAQLTDKLSRVRIIEDENIRSDEVLIGATVRVRDLDTQEEVSYMLVSAEEADFDQNKISIFAPLGKGFLYHKQGDTVEIKVPAGTLRYQILSISRE